MVPPEQSSQQHICRPQRQSPSKAKGTFMKCLLCARDCASRLNALPFTAHHLTPFHHLSIHSSEGRKRHKIQYLMAMQGNDCNPLGGVTEPRAPYYLGVKSFSHGKHGWDPQAQALEVTSCTDPSTTSPVVPPCYGCFACVSPPCWDMELFP